MEEKRAGMLQEIGIETGRFLAVKMHPHKAPGICGTAFMRIWLRTVQPDTVAGRNRETVVIIRYIATAFQHDKKKIGIQILASADVRFDALQRTDFLYVKIMFFGI